MLWDTIHRWITFVPMSTIWRETGLSHQGGWNTTTKITTLQKHVYDISYRNTFASVKSRKKRRLFCYLGRPPATKRFVDPDRTHKTEAGDEYEHRAERWVSDDNDASLPSIIAWMCLHAIGPTNTTNDYIHNYRTTRLHHPAVYSETKEHESIFVGFVVNCKKHRFLARHLVHYIP